MVLAKVARRVNGEAVVLLGWGRAILLQLAHPLVAAGVAEHSGFGGGPLNYVRRTHRTVGAMLALTFGSPEEMRDRANRINAIHRRVHGVLREPTRHFAVGTPYSATDPELLRWVHATIVESQLRAYELFVGPLTDDERDQYCAEAAEVAPLLSIPRDFLPTDAGALDRYLDAMYRSPAIEVTASARRLGRALLFPTGRQNDRAGHGDRPSGDNRAPACRHPCRVRVLVGRPSPAKISPAGDRHPPSQASAAASAPGVAGSASRPDGASGHVRDACLLGPAGARLAGRKWVENCLYRPIESNCRDFLSVCWYNQQKFTETNDSP